MKIMKVWQLLILLVLGLGVLVSQIYPSAFFSSGQTELLEVSVLLREPESTFWSNVRRGMEQSAVDWGVELRFLTLPHSNDGEEQLSLLTREVEGGTHGIILAPCDTLLLESAVSELGKSIPIVTLESDMTDSGALAYIGADHQAVGEMLAQSVMADVAVGEKVLLINSAPDSPGIMERLTTAQGILEAQGYSVEVYAPPDWTLISAYLQASVLAYNAAAVVAFESQILEEVAAFCSDMVAPPYLYGVGDSAIIVSYLEREDITAICVQNEYAIGYLAVETLVKSLGKTPVTSVDAVDITLVRPEDIYDTEIQKLLFPVT